MKTVRCVFLQPETVTFGWIRVDAIRGCPTFHSVTWETETYFYTPSGLRRLHERQHPKWTRCVWMRGATLRMLRLPVFLCPWTSAPKTGCLSESDLLEQDCCELMQCILNLQSKCLFFNIYLWRYNASLKSKWWVVLFVLILIWEMTVGRMRLLCLISQRKICVIV